MRIKLQHAHAVAGDLDLGSGEQIDPSRIRRIGFYFEIQADGNHETLATSEVYNTYRDAIHAIGLLRADGFDAELVDETA